MAIDRERVRQQYRDAATDTATDSGLPLKPFYTQEDMAGLALARDLGLPGEFPFTRGHHPLMYRGKLWNIRQITGLSTPREYNRRLRMEVAEGVGALTYHVDEIANYGLEPDQPYAEGRIGVTGVTSNWLGDVETALEGLPLEEVSLCPACTSPLVSQSILLAAQHRGYAISQLRHAIDKEILELPAGTTEPGESPEDCVRRELREEIGYEPGVIENLGGFYSAPGYSTEYLHLFLATELAPNPATAEDTEYIKPLTLPLSEVPRLIASGEIEDAKTIAGLYLFLLKLPEGHRFSCHPERSEGSPDSSLRSE